MARTFRTVDGKGSYQIRLAGRRGEALEAFWAKQTTSRDTLSALRGIKPATVPPSPACAICDEPGDFKPSHDGMPHCKSGSLASGGNKAHCTCDTCF